MSIISFDTLRLAVSPKHTEALIHKAPLPEMLRNSLCRDIAHNKWMIIGTLAIIALSIFVTYLSSSESIHQPVNVRCRSAACALLIVNIRLLFGNLEFANHLADST